MWLLLRAGELGDAAEDARPGTARDRWVGVTVPAGLAAVGPANTEQLGAGRSAAGRPAPAPSGPCNLGRRHGVRLVGPLESLSDTDRRESEPRPPAGADAYRAELAGVLVHPGARLAVEPSDLSGIDERLGPCRRQAAQPHGQPLCEQVRKPIERIVVVEGRIEDGCGGRSSGRGHPSGE
jgi:hypothetical protein